MGEAGGLSSPIGVLAVEKLDPSGYRAEGCNKT